jgi:hypothetical protein
MEDVGIFDDIWSFGIFYDHLGHFCGHLVYFSRFGMLCQE